MYLQFEPVFDRSFQDVRNLGFKSGAPRCAQDGWQLDSLSVMKSGDYIFFGQGRFDEWAAIVGRYFPDGSFRCAYPKDLYYFEILQRLSETYGPDFVYADAEYIYRHVPVRQSPADVVVLNQRFIQDIGWMSQHYYISDDSLFAERALMSVYYGMIAEENKRNSQLGAAMKLHGIYNLLKGGMSVEQAADCSVGVKAVKVYAECVRHGIFRDFPEIM